MLRGWRTLPSHWLPPQKADGILLHWILEHFRKSQVTKSSQINSTFKILKVESWTKAHYSEGGRQCWLVARSLAIQPLHSCVLLCEWFLSRQSIRTVRSSQEAAETHSLHLLHYQCDDVGLLRDAIWEAPFCNKRRTTPVQREDPPLGDRNVICVAPLAAAGTPVNHGAVRRVRKLFFSITARWLASSVALWSELWWHHNRAYSRLVSTFAFVYYCIQTSTNPMQEMIVP